MDFTSAALIIIALLLFAFLLFVSFFLGYLVGSSKVRSLAEQNEKLAKEIEILRQEVFCLKEEKLQLEAKVAGLSELINQYSAKMPND